jgi:hypothetical protein
LDWKSKEERGPLYIDPNSDLDIPLTSFERSLREMTKEEREEELKRLERILRRRGNIGRDLGIPVRDDEGNTIKTGKERRMELLNWGTDKPSKDTGYFDDYGWRHRAAEYLDRPYADEHYETGEHYNKGGRIGAQEGGLMNLGGMEKDYRQEGGFVPIGPTTKSDYDLTGLRDPFAPIGPTTKSDYDLTGLRDPFTGEYSDDDLTGLRDPFAPEKIKQFKQQQLMNRRKQDMQQRIREAEAAKQKAAAEAAADAREKQRMSDKQYDDWRRHNDAGYGKTADEKLAMTGGTEEWGEDMMGGTEAPGNGNVSAETGTDFGPSSHMIARGGLAQHAPRYANGGIARLGYANGQLVKPGPGRPGYQGRNWMGDYDPGNTTGWQQTGQVESGGGSQGTTTSYDTSSNNPSYDPFATGKVKRITAAELSEINRKEKEEAMAEALEAEEKKQIQKYIVKTQADKKQKRKKFLVASDEDEGLVTADNYGYGPGGYETDLLEFQNYPNVTDQKGIGWTQGLEGSFDAGAVRTRKFFSEPTKDIFGRDQKGVLPAGKFKYEGSPLTPERFGTMSLDEKNKAYKEYRDQRRLGQIDAYGNVHPNFRRETIPHRKVDGTIEMKEVFIPSGAGDESHMTPQSPFLQPPTTPTPPTPPTPPDDDIPTGPVDSPYTIDPDPDDFTQGRGGWFYNDGGRAGYANGGGIRQRYLFGGIGKLFKGITKPFKKITKSKLGRAAMLAALGYYMPGIGIKAKDGWGPWVEGIRDLAGEEGWKGDLVKSLLMQKGKEGDPAKFSPWKLGIGAAALYPLIMGDDDEDENKMYEDWLKEKAKWDARYADIPTGSLPFPYQRHLMGAADGGRIGYQGGYNVDDEEEDHRVAALRALYGMRRNAQEGGLMNLGGMEKDYRQEGGFVPIGGQERADDVPARLSKNEFVFTASWKI